MRVLVVEDEHRVARFLTQGLTQEACQVELAADGNEGLRKARAGEYDAIILDVMLPGMSGVEVLEELRRSGDRTPILILSAKADVDDRVQGLNLGADDYLAKPFAFSEVLARLRSLVRRSSADGAERSTELSLADLHVDLPTREVTRAGRPIELTNKEFQLLEYMLRNKNRVLSRVILLEHIWGMYYDSRTNVVDVLINRLRRKIDDEFDPPLLHTVRGVGYVMKVPTGDESGA